MLLPHPGAVQTTLLCTHHVPHTDLHSPLEELTWLWHLWENHMDTGLQKDLLLERLVLAQPIS